MTAIAGDPQANIDFYAGILGLRLVPFHEASAGPANRARRKLGPVLRGSDRSHTSRTDADNLLVEAKNRITRIMSTYIAAFLIGVVAGLRSMTAPAAVSWAARLGWINLNGTWLAFLGAAVTPYIVSLLAIGELVTDKLPKTPSRKALVPFVGRILSGALCGAALGATTDALLAGLASGVLGAVVGTLGGYQFRGSLARAAGKDFPIALFEDAIAVLGAFIIASHVS